MLINWGRGAAAAAAAGAVAGAVLLGLGASSASARAIPAYPCKATATFPTTWNGGFDLTFVVKNTGAQPINSWLVTFTFPGDDRIYTTWGGTITQTGQNVVAMGGPGPIAAGASASSVGGVVEGTGGTNITKVTCIGSIGSS